MKNGNLLTNFNINVKLNQQHDDVAEDHEEKNEKEKSILKQSVNRKYFLNEEWKKFS